MNYQLQKVRKTENGQLIFEADQDFSVSQKYQILNIRDFCNECGNCTTFCPSSGSPYKDKPGICLSLDTFKQEEKGYYLSRLPDRTILIYKEEGKIKTLSQENDKYFYESDEVKATINPADFKIEEVDFLDKETNEADFNFAAEMSVVLKGLYQIFI